MLGELHKGQVMDLKRISTLFEQRREGHTLPQALYIEAESFDFDMAAIFGQSWLMAVFSPCI
jgi:Rieske 2Fe-2S family protein